jgi:KDO2-lipid IV(A) lauroyltransferase|tara:strand:+ start:1150 stop:1983 length:834 start_codon:yes stop_codon:yes gene_type:complete
MTYSALSVLSSILKILSVRKLHILSQNIASILFNYIPKRKNTALKNLKIAFPDKSDEWINTTLKKCYSFFTYNFLQFLAFPFDPNSIEIEVVGKKYLNNAINENSGTVLVSAHFGSWEILGYWFGINNYPLVGIAQKQKNKGANLFFEEKRQLSGTKQVYRKSSMDSLYEILNANKILGLVSDQDARGKGVFVDFFNKPASTHKGAALFHLNTNASLIFGICVQKDIEKYRVEFIPINPKKKSTEDITQLYTTIIEQSIKKYPEQYFWFHNRWKTKK